MESYYFYDILTYLGVAVLVALFCKRFQVSSVLGYLAAGVVIGPHALDLIYKPGFVSALAELGVVFLLFTIGLSLSWQRLHQLRRYVFGFGTLQVFVTCVVFSAIGSFLKLPLEVAIILGGALALSSTAVVMQVLQERGEISSRWGRVAFAVLLAQDLAVVGLLVMLTLFQTQDAPLYTVLGHSILKAVGVLVAIALMGRYVLRPVFRVVAATQSSEVFMAMTLIVILGTSWVTGVVGLSMELGAFLAGLLIAETEYRHQIEGDIEAFKGLLLGLFFVSVGMAMDMIFFLSNLPTILAILVGLVVLKAVILFILGRTFSLSPAPAVRMAFLLAAGGEFVFVVLKQAIDMELIGLDEAQMVYLVVAISMAITPLLEYLGLRVSNTMTQDVGVALKAAEEETEDLSGHVIIAGYGRVGQVVSDVLAQNLVPFVAIDLQMSCVSEGRNKGLPVFYGDARRAEVMAALGADRAQAVVITLETFQASYRCVQMLRGHFPKLPLFVRVRDNAHAHTLEQMGAKAIVPETLEPSLQLAGAALEAAGILPDQVAYTIDAFRQEFMDDLRSGGHKGSSAEASEAHHA